MARKLIRFMAFPDDAATGGVSGGPGTPAAPPAGGAPVVPAAPVVEYKAPATQEDLDRLIDARLYRERQNNAEVVEKAKKYDEAQAANASELDKAVQAARDEATKQVRAEVLRDRVLDKIEVTAAGKFRDVTDARLRLGEKADSFVKDGVIDTAAIIAAVDAELVAAPHLKADTRPAPDPGAGNRAPLKTSSVSAGADLFSERRGGRRAQAAGTTTP